MGIKNKLHFIAFIFVFILFHSCYKETLDQLQNIKGVQGTPQLSVPVINDNISIKDLYKTYSAKGNILRGSDNFLTFIYEKSDTLPAQQFVSFPQLNFGYNFSLDAGSISQFNTLGTFSNSISNYIVMPFTNGERIKKLKIKSGYFLVNVSSTYKHNVNIIVTYPTVIKNGIPLSDTVKLIYRKPLHQSVPYVVGKKNIDLSGYEIDLTNGGFSYNVVPYFFQFNMTKIPGNSISLNDQIKIDDNVFITEYDYLQGYFGKFIVLQSTASSTFDIFSKDADGNVYIKDPRIKIGAENGIGIPVTAKISNVKITSGKGVSYPVNIYPNRDTFTFDYPRVSLNQMGQVFSSAFQIDRTNSNIDSLLNLAPQEVHYDIVYTANYNQNIDEDNYLFDKNTYISKTAIELPMEIIIKDYYIHKVNDMTLDPQDPNYNVEWYKLSSYFNNSLPIGASVQFYFCKKALINNIDSFVVFDSLYSSPVQIEPAIVDATGKILNNKISTNDVYMNSDRYNYLQKNVSRYMLTFHIRTSDYNHATFPYVKIYSDQAMNFKIGLEAKGKYKTH